MRKLNKIITAAAMVSAILAGSTPKAAATGCPYTVGPLGRYIVPAEVCGLYADGDAVQVWCSDLWDGDDWYFAADAETDLRIFDRVQLVIDANGTPDDFSDDRVIDAFWSCCEVD